MKRALFVIACALVACDRGSAPRSDAAASPEVLPPHPPYADDSLGRTLREAPLHDLESPDALSPFFAAKVGDHDVLVLLDVRGAPGRWRSEVAMYRLARALGLEIVPATVPRAFRWRDLLDAASDEATLRRMREEPIVRPDGRVAGAIVAAPPGARSIAARFSNECFQWTNLAGAAEPPPADVRPTVDDFVAMLVLDYLTANLFRRMLREDERGRLHLVDNRSAFAEHPDARAIEDSLEALRAVRWFPGGLEDALLRLDEEKLDAIFRAGSYDDWLVQKRPIREILLRARAVATLVHARDATR